MNWTRAHWRDFLKHRYGECFILDGENRLHVVHHVKDVRFWFIRFEVSVLCDVENDMEPFGVMIAISF